jgi:RimJ/RimL family protein N-acetyltransferase
MLDGEVRIEPLEEQHRVALRQACAEDPEVWSIYPMSFFGEQFDASFDACFGNAKVLAFALFDGERLVGMSSYFVDPANMALEIGRTYVSPRMRGHRFQQARQAADAGSSFRSALQAVQFQIDTRNTRSMAAVEKLGAGA